MEVTYKIILDFARPNKTKTIEIMQNDVRSRKVQLVLMNNGRPVDGTEIGRVIIKAYKPDETIIFAEANIVQKAGVNTNVVEYTLPADAARIVGKSIYAAVIYETSLAQITSPEWYVNVTKQLYDEEDYISGNELSGFMQYVAQALEAKTSAQASANTCTAAITGAQTAQAAAETAKTGAETAQTAAEAAQAAAEAAAQTAAETITTAGVVTFNGRSGQVTPASGDYSASQITYQNGTVGSFLSTLGSRQSLLLAAHPVGSIYMSTQSTPPSTLFGGVWQRLRDRFIVAAGDTYTPGSTGGSSTHTHDGVVTESAAVTGVASGTTGTFTGETDWSRAYYTGEWSGDTGQYSGNTGITAITADQMPAHTHEISMIRSSSEASGYGLTTSSTFQNRVYVYHASQTVKTKSTGGGSGHTHKCYHHHSIPAHTHEIGTHNHRLPEHTHTINMNIGISGHTHNVPAFTGDNMPPYLAVYCWIRTE